MGVDLDELQSPGKGVNFTMFLTMMGEHLFEFDTETELIEAFECFDEGDTGFVKAAEFRKFLKEGGDRMDEREVGFALAVSGIEMPDKAL
jgi:myosin regulatory light chain 12